MAADQTRYIHEEPGKLFHKTVLLPKDVISEIFGVQLFVRDSQEALSRLLLCVCTPKSLYFPHLWLPSNTPLPSALQSAVADGNAGTLRELLQSQKSQKFQFCGFEGISKLRSGRPQRFGGLGLVSVGLDQSHRHWGVSSFVWVKLGCVSIIQQERRTPVAAFSFWK